MNENTIRTIHNHRPFNPLEVQARCPKCHSVFIAENHCESCSYQLDFDLLGTPFDSKSFFSQVEIFNLKAPLLYRLSNSLLRRDHKIVRKHTRLMKKRFYDLGEYIFDRIDDDKERRRMFLFEMEQLIPYLINLGCHEEEVYAYLEGNSRHPLSQRLLKALSTSSGPMDKSFLQYLFDFKIKGILKVGFLFQAILMGMAMSFAGYLFLKFLSNTI